MTKIVMVHLDHPCRGIDIWEVSENEIRTAKMQGYIALEELKLLREKNRQLQDLVDQLLSEQFHNIAQDG